MKSILMKFVLIVLLATLSGCSDLLTAPEENENNRPSITLSFKLRDSSHLLLYVTTYNFELVKVIYDGEISGGNQSFTWGGDDYNGDQIASGVYYYFFITDNYSSGKQMILVK